MVPVKIDMVFFSKCSEVVTKYFSLKTHSRREVKFTSKPWITKVLRKSINYKNILYIDNSLEINLLLVTTNIESIETNLQGYFDLAKSFTSAIIF